MNNNKNSKINNNNNERQKNRGSENRVIWGGKKGGVNATFIKHDEQK